MHRLVSGTRLACQNVQCKGVYDRTTQGLSAVAQS